MWTKEETKKRTKEREKCIFLCLNSIAAKLGLQLCETKLKTTLSFSITISGSCRSNAHSHTHTRLQTFFFTFNSATSSLSNYNRRRDYYSLNWLLKLFSLARSVHFVNFLFIHLIGHKKRSEKITNTEIKLHFTNSMFQKSEFCRRSRKKRNKNIKKECEFVDSNQRLLSAHARLYSFNRKKNAFRA